MAIFSQGVNKDMESLDLGRIVLNDNPASFLIEVLFRSFITFILVFVFLRFIGRRGVKQMTPLEVVIILVLGTAAGDVALQEDAPLLPAIVSFVVIVSVYRVFTLCVRRSDRLQKILEGKPMLVVKHGRLVWDNVKRSSIPFDEFSLELRQKSIEHLGQIRLAFLEIDGNVSVFYYKDEDVRPGLSIIERYLEEENIDSKNEDTNRERYFSCRCCGNTVLGLKDNLSKCPVCLSNDWTLSVDSIRIE
ncbi:DUF421 domain-containing protein [Advenella kashmirensis]|nr:YetF domain-containing protein [Advenella kashmirensis]